MRRNFLIILSVLLVGSNVFAVQPNNKTNDADKEVPVATRIVRTQQVIPNTYNYNNQHCDCYHNYRGNYNRVPNRYYRGANTYYAPQRRTNPFMPVNRNMYYPNHNVIYRSSSKAPVVENEKMISFDYDASMHDVKLSVVEKNIYGKSFENQNMNLRLNRIEKSLFNKTYKGLSYEDRINNIFVNYNNESKQISPNNLSKLESKVFNRTFGSDTEKSRVSRLEEKMLGAIQEGDLKDRVDTLNRVSRKSNQVSNVPSSYGTCYGGYPAYNNKGWKGALNTLGLMFGGCPTGFTPGMDPYYDNFGLTDGGSQDYWGGNGGYGYSNRRAGSGTGVTILD